MAVVDQTLEPTMVSLAATHTGALQALPSLTLDSQRPGPW
jgi:hypothetical protein